jgi:hypothetical protein
MSSDLAKPLANWPEWFRAGVRVFDITATLSKDGHARLSIELGTVVLRPERPTTVPKEINRRWGTRLTEWRATFDVVVQVTEFPFQRGSVFDSDLPNQND